MEKQVLVDSKYRLFQKIGVGRTSGDSDDAGVYYAIDETDNTVGYVRVFLGFMIDVVWL